MEERGTEAESSGTQSTQLEAATSRKAIPDSQPEREFKTLNNRKESNSPDSSLQDAQNELVLSLTKLVQSTVEKETKALLRQIRDNNEHQTTLLKAALADSWCDPGQRAQIRAALSSQEPWKASDDTLVSIQIDTNDQEVDETNMSYPLRYLCHEFEDRLQPERIAMVIILAIWGFRKFVNDRPESIAADLDALGEVMSQGTVATIAQGLGRFLDSLDSVHYWLSRGARMDLRLKRGETYLRIKPRVSESGQFANEEFAKIMMQRENRTRRESDYCWVRYNKGLEPLQGGENPPEFGSISIVKAPSTQKKESFLSMAALATTISLTAITAPGGLTNGLANLAMGYLLVFAGPWRAIDTSLGSTSRLYHQDWQLPEMLRRTIRLKLNMLAVHHTIRVLSPVETEPHKPSEGIPLSRVVGHFDGSAFQRDGMDTGLTKGTLTEKRASIWLTTTISMMQPVFRGVFLSDSKEWCFAVSTMSNIGPGENREINPGIRTCKWLGGISIYQRTLMVALEVWHREWNKTFDSVDKVLNVRLEDVFDSEKRAALMFESSSNNKFESSDKYFFVIELLRISAEWIKETVNDLLFSGKRLPSSIISMMSRGKLVPMLSVTTDWEVILRDLKRHEDDLLGRIERKTQEVKSLRDGINESILVFTVMTITYLPLGFVATLYGLDMFDFQMPGQTTSFAITTVVVSLATYLAAWGFLYEVRQQRKKKGFQDRFPYLTNWIQWYADLVFGASKRAEKATGFSSTPDIEVDIHNEIPLEEQHVHEKKTFYSKAIPYWLMRRRRGRKARLSMREEEVGRQATRQRDQQRPPV
ncbi:hypothetical protein PGQ11_002651 [Apiospora arundinis]|uniref:Uncharacterized protein n=1 Tax=Apiospora arundinis TaxID=335852 RepID=A0ABR2JKZ7_9PEZI